MAKSKKDGGQINWVAIKSYYITHNVSLEKTAEKYGVDASGVKRRAKAENWVAAKKEKHKEIELKVIQKSTEKRIDELAEIREIASDEIREIKEAMQRGKQLHTHIVTESAPNADGLGTISVTYEKEFEKIDINFANRLADTLDKLERVLGYMKPGDLEKLQLEREKFEWEKAQAEKKEEEEKLDNDISIQIGGYEDEWSN